MQGEDDPTATDRAADATDGSSRTETVRAFVSSLGLRNRLKWAVVGFLGMVGSLYAAFTLRDPNLTVPLFLLATVLLFFTGLSLLRGGDVIDYRI